MRKLLRFLLYRPIQWIVDTFSSAPDRARVFASLSGLADKIKATGGKKGFTIPFDVNTGKFIIFSDQHKGRKNGADEFAPAEKNYIAALEYYNAAGFHFISLGDSEELWENTLLQVRKHNKSNFEAEKMFVARSAFTKIFGNHDLDWQVDPLAPVYLKEIYGTDVIALEGVMLQTTIGAKTLDIFCTHGHQGDMQSDGNRLSKFIVAKIWAPLQAYLKIVPHTPSYDQHLKTVHNLLMYEWASQQKNLILITGHTHQPVFESMTHLERLQVKRAEDLSSHNKEWAEAIKVELEWRPADEEDYSFRFGQTIKSSYFNSGCCCFGDGSITGLEINDGSIRLIQWKEQAGQPSRLVLEQIPLKILLEKL